MDICGNICHTNYLLGGVLLGKLTVLLLAHFMVQSIHYCDKQTPPLVLILSHINSVNTLPSHFLQVHFNIILSSIPSLQSSPVPSGIAIKIMYAPPLSPLYAACPTQLILHYQTPGFTPIKNNSHITILY